MRRSRLRRCLPGLATSAHQVFELAVGSGVIGQARVGLPAATALSALLDAAWVAAALDRRRGWDRLLSAGAGAALAAPALHFSLFPWSLSHGVPVLSEAEGLRRGPALAAYNAVLYGWALAGVTGLVHAQRGRRRWAIVGVAAATAFRSLAREHLLWIREEGRRRPAWWNRAWVGVDDATAGPVTSCRW